MPELPEVETVARSLAPFVTGRVIEDVRLAHKPSLHEQSLPLEEIVGASIKGVKRRGKLLVFELAPLQDANKPAMILFHLRMTGKLLVAKADETPGKHCRCQFLLRKDDGDRLKLFFDDIRTFGKIMASTPERLLAWDFWKKLGPEPLEMKTTELFPRLRGSRPIKSALLDQEIIAGIGNIYADESLFSAGINPLRPAGSLDAGEAESLMKAIRKILKAAIEKGGSSIRDYVDAQGKAGGFQNSFAVYGRGGKECAKCGATLVKTKLGGRATVFCPVCQK